MVDFIFDRELVRATMKAQRISRSDLAQVVGLPHASAVSKILSGERQVKIGEAARIYERLKLVAVEHAAVRVVPVIGFASAGLWREAVEVPIGRMTLPHHIASSSAFAVEIKGDSMNLLIDDGGWIVIDPEDKALRNGKAYLLQNGNDEVTVKRFCSQPARFEPVSSNSEHTPFLVSEQDFVVLGRVVWKGEAV